MTDPNNGKVTLAVLGEKMDNVQDLLQAHCDRGVIGHKDHEDRIRANEAQLVRLDQRFGWLAGILGVLQVGLIAVVTWLGLQG